MTRTEGINPSKISGGGLSAIILIVALTLFSTPAYAYIDPASGSMFIQALVLAIAGGLLTISVYWQRLKAFLGFGKRQEDKDPKEPE